MPQTVTIILITAALLFPIWANLLWRNIIRPRKLFGSKSDNLINATVNIWVLNIAVLDGLLLLSLVITLATTNPEEASFGKNALVLWSVMRWILGLILFGNIVTLTQAIRDGRDYPNQDQIITRTYAIAGSMILIYLAYQLATFMLATL